MLSAFGHCVTRFTQLTSYCVDRIKHPQPERFGKLDLQTIFY